MKEGEGEVMGGMTEKEEFGKCRTAKRASVTILNTIREV